ncbi:MAG TPA: peptidylprolyl isomerase [Methylomirabilota bacterium]|nr:peptidylprolyl isomerase [Methylomirabilota bacterium]
MPCGLRRGARARLGLQRRNGWTTCEKYRPLRNHRNRTRHLVVELYPKVAPKTVGNFETLVNKGFYNGLTWHRVVPDFVVQGGDPDGTGMGGPGYNVPAEIDKNEHHLRGTLATARKGDEANPQRESSGSQFYVCLAPQPSLDNGYTIFGGVIKGMDVVDQIQKGDHMKKITLAKEPPK